MAASSSGAAEHEPPAPPASAAELSQELARALLGERFAAGMFNTMHRAYKEHLKLLEYVDAAKQNQLGDEQALAQLGRIQTTLERYHAQAEQWKAAREVHAREAESLRERLAVAQALEARGEVT